MIAAKSQARGRRIDGFSRPAPRTGRDELVWPSRREASRSKVAFVFEWLLISDVAGCKHRL